MVEMHDKYPGIEFVPPPGTVGMHDEEGEEMVTWKKIGDRYTLTSFGGKEFPATMPDESEPSEPTEDMPEESPRDELHRLATY